MCIRHGPFVKVHESGFFMAIAPLSERLGSVTFPRVDSVSRRVAETPVLQQEAAGVVGEVQREGDPLLQNILEKYTRRYEVAEAETLLSGEVQLLSEAGRYDILGDERYQGAVKSFINQYQDPVVERKLRGAYVREWLTERYHFIENHSDKDIHEPVAHFSPEVFAQAGRTNKLVLQQLFTTFKRINQFKENPTYKSLHTLEQTSLVAGKRGPLRFQPPKGLLASALGNSQIQQERMFLLSLKGISMPEAEVIASYVREYPNLGRGNTGKVVVGIEALTAHVVQFMQSQGLHSSEEEARVEEFVKHMRMQARHGWPTPAEGTPKPFSLRRGQKSYWLSVDNARRRLMATVSAGEILPDLATLPADTITLDFLSRLRRYMRDTHSIIRRNLPVNSYSLCAQALRKRKRGNRFIIKCQAEFWDC
jgi:hypothetical protein